MEHVVTREVTTRLSMDGRFRREAFDQIVSLAQRSRMPIKLRGGVNGWYIERRLLDEFLDRVAASHPAFLSDGTEQQSAIDRLKNANR